MKKFHEKYNLLTAIIICFLFYVVISWIIPTGSIASSAFTKGDSAPIGLFGLAYYSGMTIGTFIQYGLIMLAIGAFYGVMVKTGAYGKLVDDVSKKFKGNEKVFLIICISLMVIASSVTGLPFALLVIVPFLMGIITKLGYNKITAVVATVGSMLVGNIGSTFGYTISGMSSNILGLEIANGILSKLILLVIVLFLFVLFVVGNKEARLVKVAKKEEPKKTSKTTKKETIAEVKTSEKAIFLENADEKVYKKTLPLKILFIVTLIIAFVSMFNWNIIFKVTLFEDFYEKVIGITVSDYPILSNILDLTNPFGYWDSYELIALLLISSVIIGWVYNLSLSELLEGMKSGARRLLKPACYIIFANIIFALCLSSTTGSMMIYITEKLSTITDSFNVFTTAITGVIGSFFYNNYYYFFSSITSDLLIHVDDSSYTLMTFVLQSMYGIMMLILPTSLILVSGLSMLGVSFKEWIKYIWKFVVQIMIIVIIIIVILALLA